jgi:GNAT superfamily N-acetyltransferase
VRQRKYKRPARNSMNQAPAVEVYDGNDPARLTYLGTLGEQLVKYHRYAGCADYRELHAIIRKGAGKLLGGCIAATHSGWLYVEFLWVASRFRRKGYGSQILAAAEREALTRGCTKAHLEATGPGIAAFFQHQGYAICGELIEYLPGQSRYWFRKDLVSKQKQPRTNRRN